MPRAPRIEYAGAIYHVMNRGDHLEPIFKDEQDRILFLKTLGQTAQSAGWSIHSFVLMNNHYHLLLETHRSSLVKGMQYLNSTYTQRYNARHRTRGHLFQGRYKALLVDGDSSGYFLAVSDYIHMNPVRIGKAKTLKQLIEDPWNSTGWLAGSRKERPEWLPWQRVFGEMGIERWNRTGKKEYRTHLSEQIERVGEEKGWKQWKQIRRGWCFGSEGFVSKMRERLEELGDKERDQESWSGEAVEEAEQHRAARLLKEALPELGYENIKKIKGHERYLVAKWLRRRTQVRVKWLAEQFGVRTRNGMSNGIYLVGPMIEQDRFLKSQWKKLEML